MMKKLLFLCLIIFCPLLVFPQSYNEGYINYLDYQAYIDDLFVIDTTDHYPPLAPILFVSIVGFDSTKTTADYRGSDLDSFFFRWDTTGYPTTKTSGIELLSGAAGDTVNEITWGYDFAQSSKTLYLRCFVQDSLGNLTYGQDSQIDNVPPDIFDSTPTVVYTPPNLFDVTWTPTDIDSRDIDSLILVLTKLDEGGGRTIRLSWASALSDSDRAVGVGLNCVYPDTIEPCTFEITLKDEIGNSIELDPILDTMTTHGLMGMDVTHRFVDLNNDALLDTAEGTWHVSSYVSYNTPWQDTNYTKFTYTILHTRPPGSSCSYYIDWGFGLKDTWQSTGSYIEYLNNMYTDSTHSLYSGWAGLPIRCQTTENDVVYAFSQESYLKNHNSYQVNIYGPICGMDSSHVMTIPGEEEGIFNYLLNLVLQ